MGGESLELYLTVLERFGLYYFSRTWISVFLTWVQGDNGRYRTTTDEHGKYDCGVACRVNIDDKQGADTPGSGRFVFIPGRHRYHICNRQISIDSGRRGTIEEICYVGKKLVRGWRGRGVGVHLQLARSFPLSGTQRHRMQGKFFGSTWKWILAFSL